MPMLQLVIQSQKFYLTVVMTVVRNLFFMVVAQPKTVVYTLNQAANRDKAKCKTLQFLVWPLEADSNKNQSIPIDPI